MIIVAVLINEISSYTADMINSLSWSPSIILTIL